MYEKLFLLCTYFLQHQPALCAYELRNYNEIEFISDSCTFSLRPIYLTSAGGHTFIDDNL